MNAPARMQLGLVALWVLATAGTYPPEPIVDDDQVLDCAVAAGYLIGVADALAIRNGTDYAVQRLATIPATDCDSLVYQDAQLLLLDGRDPIEDWPIDDDRFLDAPAVRHAVDVVLEGL